MLKTLYELLGTPGQFYLDHASSRIYYVPRPGEDLTKADIELPVLESLVNISGTAANPVHNIVFSGLQFSYATWLAPNGQDGILGDSGGLSGDGSGVASLLETGAVHAGAGRHVPIRRVDEGDREVVALHFAHNIQFLRDAFVHLGAAGLDLGDGAQHDVVEGSVFTDISGNGLELAGVAQPLAPHAQFSSDNRIDNNLFEKCRRGVPRRHRQS